MFVKCNLISKVKAINQLAINYSFPYRSANDIRHPPCKSNFPSELIHKYYTKKLRASKLQKLAFSPDLKSFTQVKYVNTL